MSDPNANLLTSGLAGRSGLTAMVLSIISPDLLKKALIHPRYGRFLWLLLTAPVAGNLLYSALTTTWRYLIDNFTSSLIIKANDSLYTYILRWLESQKTFLPTRSARVQLTTTQKSREPAWNAKDATGDTETFHYRTKPDGWSQMVIHKSRLFYASVTMEGRTPYIILRCFGFSIKPIQGLLETVYEAQKNVDSDTTTNIYKLNNEASYYNDSAWWRLASQKANRNLDTVDLDAKIKSELVRDVRRYLSPKTQDWYKARGIPYRRGYLFHGPPGTGKSSLSLSLASHFHLDIFTLSLLDPHLSDHTLGRLFAGLPPRALVLLEDVDSAGVSRNLAIERNKKGKKTKRQKYGDAYGSKVSWSNVTLAGLLNALDGVDASEGHVLVMTTNLPDELDHALKRPGRVDMKVAFYHATKMQAKAIFVRIFNGFTPVETETVSEEEENDAAAPPSENGKGGDSGYASSSEMNQPPIDIEALAEKFAENYEDGSASPAELQEYCLAWRTNPKGAVEGVKDWVDVLNEEEGHKEGSEDEGNGDEIIYDNGDSSSEG